MHLIATVAHKGGTGKTTITAALAGHWAAQGRNVVVVDFDPQGGLSAFLGIPEGYGGTTIADVVLRNRDPFDALVGTKSGIYVMPGSLELATAELELPQKHGWQDLLRRRLDRLSESEGMDLVLVDSAPGLGVLPYMALRSADDALVVVTQSYPAMRVLPYMLETAQRAGTNVVGIVPSMVDHRTSHSREAGAKLADDYGDQMLTPIPRRVALEDAALAGVPIQQHAPKSDAVDAIAQLAGEIEHGSIWNTDDL